MSRFLDRVFRTCIVGAVEYLCTLSTWHHLWWSRLGRGDDNISC